MPYGKRMAKTSRGVQLKFGSDRPQPAWPFSPAGSMRFVVKSVWKRKVDPVLIQIGGCGMLLGGRPLPSPPQRRGW